MLCNMQLGQNYQINHPRIVSITPFYMSTIKQAPEDTIYPEKFFKAYSVPYT